MDKKISKLISELDIDVSSEQTTVTSFSLSKIAVYSIQWVTKTWGITKQKLFDKITENDILLSAAASIGSKKKNKDNEIQIIKQRITKKNLEMINSISKYKNIPRDELVSETLTLLYMSLSKKYNEDIKQTYNVKSDIDKSIKAINSLEKRILVNKHLEKSYYQKILDIKTKLEKLAETVNDDIIHYNSNNDTSDTLSENIKLDTEDNKNVEKELEKWGWSMLTSRMQDYKREEL